MSKKKLTRADYDEIVRRLLNLEVEIERTKADRSQKDAQRAKVREILEAFKVAKDVIVLSGLWSGLLEWLRRHQM